MWRDIFTKSESRTNALFAQLARDIATHASRTEDLNSRLMSLAVAVTELPDVLGAMFVACDDEGLPISYKAINLSMPNELPQLNSICKAEDSLAKGWFEPLIDRLEAPDAKTVLARIIPDGDVAIGMILLGLAEGTEENDVLAAVEQTVDHFKWAIRDALQLERKRLSEGIFRLQEEELSEVEQISPQRIIERVKDVFNADTATLLVREQGSSIYLRLQIRSSLGML